MKTYYVKVAIRILEVYKVQADDEASARDSWSDGELIRTCDEALDSEVVSVREG